MDRPSRQRFVVLAGVAAVGKRISELDFVRSDVSVERVERDDEIREPAPGFTQAEGDFPHLSGPAPALTKAWYYLCDG